jgi:hypothetical protein
VRILLPLLELSKYVLESFSSVVLTDSFDCQELEPLVGVIVSQIRALFGLPPTFVKNSKTGIYGVPAAVTGIADWFVALSLSYVFLCLFLITSLFKLLHDTLVNLNYLSWHIATTAVYKLALESYCVYHHALVAVNPSVILLVQALSHPCFCVVPVIFTH